MAKLQRRQRNFIERCLHNSQTLSSHSGVNSTQLGPNLYAVTSPGRARLFKEKIANFWEHQALDLKNISWLTPTHERQCNWVWGKLAIEVKKDLDQQRQQLECFIFTNFSFDCHAATTEERYIAIIDYFDYWNQPMTSKLLCLSNLKAAWYQYQHQRSSYTRDTYKWLIKNDSEQCEWTWGFLRKKICLLNIQLSPRNANEMYHDTILLLDLLWPSFPNEYNSFISELRNAWAQQKIRNRTKDDVTLSPAMKKKLAKVAKKLKCTSTEAIEHLIDKELS